MNILLISQLFFSKGGSEHIFRLISKLLVENNHQVWIITNKINEKKNFNHKNIKIIEIGPEIKYQDKLPNGIIENIKFIWNVIFSAKKIIKDEKIQIIHSNSLVSGIAGSILSSLNKIPHIITIHDIISVEKKQFLKDWKKENKISNFQIWIIFRMERFLNRINVDCIHTVSKSSNQDLKRIGINKKINIIPNSIEENSIESNEVDKFQFIYIGRLVFYKNFETIIKAIAIVKKIEPKIKLKVIGNGPKKEEFQKIITRLDLRNQIIFSKDNSDEEKFKNISASNALIFPSIFEGFGLVILEAFSKSRPVLASNLSPMSEIINNETGFLIEPFNEEKWAEQILKCIQNFDQTNKMGINGKEVFDKQYNTTNLYKKIIKMYESVIKQKSSIN